ncbi:MAG: plasmid pRiA4b ORF-3 family protein [Parcubacteria group bacterium]|nr:plasmid pRiA4b ORF-3 family protein [Parcubacteria group bacterium]
MEKPANSGSILQFKIILNYSTPRIWRRILVPADCTFFALHCAIQNAMGWTDGHLHAFHVGEQKGKDRITIEFPNPETNDFYRPGENRDERKEHVANYFGKTIKQCVYCYDFGDNWGHTVLLECELPRDPKTPYPRCVAGENACPPEDCGGVWGYEDLQKILKNPRHQEHAEMLEWLGIDDQKEFDPRQFCPSEVEFENPKKRLVVWNKGFRL